MVGSTEHVEEDALCIFCQYFSLKPTEMDIIGNTGMWLSHLLRLVTSLKHGRDVLTFALSTSN